MADEHYDVLPHVPAPTQPRMMPAVVVEKENEEGFTTEELADAAKYQGVAILGYFLFLIPLLIGAKSRYARYHANQGLIINLLWLVLAMLTFVRIGIFALVDHFIAQEKQGMIGYANSCLLIPLEIAAAFGIIYLMIQGIVNAANAMKQPLPFFGNFTLIHEEFGAAHRKFVPAPEVMAAPAAPVAPVAPVAPALAPAPASAAAPAPPEASGLSLPYIVPENPDNSSKLPMA